MTEFGSLKLEERLAIMVWGDLAFCDEAIVTDVESCAR